MALGARIRAYHGMGTMGALAIVVIALFYSRGISVAWLGVGVAGLIALVLLNRARVDSTLVYALLGGLVWFAFLNSGVHATIAGVLVAFTIPTTSRLAPLEFTGYARDCAEKIEAADVEGAHVLETDTQQDMAFHLRRASSHVASPLQRMEHALHPFTTFVVLPLFALANASLRVVGTSAGTTLLRPVVVGVFLGLLVGKPLGIGVASWLAVRMNLADLPNGISWRHVVGAGILGGIGFTMSLFIANLAFADPAVLADAKLAVLATSLVAGVAGWAFLRFATAPATLTGG